MSGLIVWYASLRRTIKPNMHAAVLVTVIMDMMSAISAMLLRMKRTRTLGEKFCESTAKRTLFLGDETDFTLLFAVITRYSKENKNNCSVGCRDSLTGALDFARLTVLLEYGVVELLCAVLFAINS